VRRRLVEQVLWNGFQLWAFGELALDVRERRKWRAILPNNEMRPSGAAETDLRELASDLACESLGVLALTTHRLPTCAYFARGLRDAFDNRLDRHDLRCCCQPLQSKRTPRRHAPISPAVP